jgi:hypothetical protein
LNDGLYPEFYYSILSWFITPSVEISVILMRVASALVLTLVLAALFWLAPQRYRTACFLTILAGFSATGFLLFSSINPSGWASLGVGFSWLPLHAALTADELGRRRRLGLAMVACCLSLLAVASRFDSYYFLAFSFCLVALHVFALRKVRHQKGLFVSAVALIVLGTVVLDKSISISLLKQSRNIFTFTEGQRDNISFISENSLEVIPNMLGALGSVPTHSLIVLPQIVLVINLLVLAFLMRYTFNHSALIQGFGVAATVVFAAFTIMAQIALVDERDSGPIEPRYVYPLLLLALSWWFLHGVPRHAERLFYIPRSAILASVVVTGLVTFTVTERFVDRQTSGLRYLPEGRDQWWWSWLPVGPNVLVALAPVFLWRFLNQTKHLLVCP